MSEYQRIAFRAIDGPVSARNLDYMRQQSSRAEITPWSFDNEYHYGDFRGNAAEMLRRGYDLFVHYANFGIRTIHLRFPHGLPNFQAAEPYLGEESMNYVSDKKGPGGILCIEPFFEPGELDEPWDDDDLIARLVPLRAELLDGDLRPLYLAHLAVASDGNHDPEEAKEGPVPAGLSKLTDAQRALLEYLGVDDLLIAAAAEGSPPLAARGGREHDYTDWLRQQSQATKDQWLAEWLTDPNSSARQDILAEFRKRRPEPPWPTADPGRTIAELRDMAEALDAALSRKAADKATRDRSKRLAEMAADPAPTLRKTEQLASQRSEKAYIQIAELLTELREALEGTEQAGLAEQQAQKLKEKWPTLKLLMRHLRLKGFVPKQVGP
jgi:hypothetical protein